MFCKQNIIVSFLCLISDIIGLRNFGQIIELLTKYFEMSSNFAVAVFWASRTSVLLNNEVHILVCTLFKHCMSGKAIGEGYTPFPYSWVLNTRAGAFINFSGFFPPTNHIQTSLFTTFSKWTRQSPCVNVAFLLCIFKKLTIEHGVLLLRAWQACYPEKSPPPYSLRPLTIFKVLLYQASENWSNLCPQQKKNNSNLRITVAILRPC